MGQNFGVDRVGLRCFVKGIIKSFAKFTGKHMSWTLLLNKVQAVKTCKFI